MILKSKTVPEKKKKKKMFWTTENLRHTLHYSSLRILPL
jgi:hypothetical protein